MFTCTMMRLILLVLLVIVTLNILGLSADIRTTNFYKDPTQSQGITVSASYGRGTIASCAAQCLSVFTTGYFVHNKATLQCNCGHTLTSTPLSQGDVLYKNHHCDSSVDFNEFTIETGEVLCLKFDSTPLPYLDAVNYCSALSSRVFVADTDDKLYLIRTEFGASKNVWIGLDDIQEDGKFVWADGREMTATETSQLFLSTQPDGGTSENCVVIYWFQNVLHDVGCSPDYHFICELSI